MSYEAEFRPWSLVLDYSIADFPAIVPPTVPTRVLTVATPSPYLP